MNELQDDSTIISASTGTTSQKSNHYLKNPSSTKTQFSITKVKGEFYGVLPIFNYDTSQVNQTSQSYGRTYSYEEKYDRFKLGLASTMSNNFDYLIELAYTDSTYTTQQTFSFSTPMNLPHQVLGEFGVNLNNIKVKSSFYTTRTPSNANSYSIFAKVKFAASNRISLASKLAVNLFGDTHYADPGRILEAGLHSDTIYEFTLDYYTNDLGMNPAEAESLARDAVEDSLGSYGLEVLDLNDGAVLKATNTTALKTEPNLSLQVEVLYAMTEGLNLGLSYYYQQKSHIDRFLGTTQENRSRLRESAMFLDASYEFQ